MKETTNQFSLVGDKFMLEIQLRQPGFSFSICRLFSKNKEPIQKFKETGGSNHIYQNKLDKVCFQHDMVYEDFKYLPKRTIADKISHDKAFRLLKIQRMMDVKMDLVQWFINFSIKILLIQTKEQELILM